MVPVPSPEYASISLPVAAGRAVMDTVVANQPTDIILGQDGGSAGSLIVRNGGSITVAASGATGNGERIEPGLVYALMREESGYRPSVVSVSGARGLLQIMPETGARLARDLALEGYDADQLFVPAVNIRMGSYYLQTLLARFSGRVSAAVASYNAGPEAVSRWTDAALEDDEWVEGIPYSQTRTYVMRVLRSLYAYRVLY